jgi:hypothetical protein
MGNRYQTRALGLGRNDGSDNNFVEVEPTRYLPILRRLIEEATIEDLKCITGDSYRGRWGPRRSLVWLAEKMQHFLNTLMMLNVFYSNSH